MPSRDGNTDDAICPLEMTGGVDWFRYRVDDFKGVRETRDAIEVIQDEDVGRSSKKKPWRFQGYQGWATDRLRWGTRGGKILWECSGPAAASTWTALPLSGGKATRVDLQLTLSLSKPLRTFGMQCMPPSMTSSPTPQPSRIRYGQSVDSSGLWCGTAARRTNATYLRLYDKGVEQRDAEPGRRWRLELEAKYEHAEELCNSHREKLSDPLFCAKYSVQSWRSLGCSWPISDSDDTYGAIVRPKRPVPTAGSLAIWLTRTVRPVIPRLLTAFTVSEVLEMLGLETHAAPVRRYHENAG